LKLNLCEVLHNKLYDIPNLPLEIEFNLIGEKNFRVTDRVNTGTTFEFVKERLSKAADFKTLSLNGIADYYLYNETSFRFPGLV